uniref:Sulfotransferase domain-containing protein n=1 Tax=Corethron hystrix TaxID=216773 RepID=A0A7S1BHW9_9STRA|mmetsp:Transcript_27690/g.63461  ORF Transcript_27690/g.63461 Transcript_27690/m.63461 type:complete len:351 (+) Transcript_27690:203-1255(+)
MFRHKQSSKLSINTLPIVETCTQSDDTPKNRKLAKYHHSSMSVGTVLSAALTAFSIVVLFGAFSESSIFRSYSASADLDVAAAIGTSNNADLTPSLMMASEESALRYSTVQNALPVVDSIAINPFSDLASPPPLPYIVVGMPKSGTTSIHEYFSCGKRHRASHFICKGKTHACPSCLPNVCAVCMQNNLMNNGPTSPLLQGCGTWDVFTELDACMMLKNPENPVCYYPQVTDLEGIHASYPSATFILNLRNVDQWISSVGRYKDLARCLVNCDITDVLPRGIGGTTDELHKFYTDHTERVREFVKKRPTHQLVEVNIDEDIAGKQMEKIFGIPAECFGHANQNTNNAKRI